MSAGALQKVLYERLAQDETLIGLTGAGRVFDAVPKSRQFPFVAFGDLAAEDWSTSDGKGNAYTITLRAWSAKQGRKELYEIAARICQLMASHVQTPPGSALHIVLIQQLSQRYERDISARAMRATLRFRILTEPNS